jgi:hypothetical protein
VRVHAEMIERQAMSVKLVLRNYINVEVRDDEARLLSADFGSELPANCNSSFSILGSQFLMLCRRDRQT